MKKSVSLIICFLLVMMGMINVFAGTDKSPINIVGTWEPVETVYSAKTNISAITFNSDGTYIYKIDLTGLFEDGIWAGAEWTGNTSTDYTPSYEYFFGKYSAKRESKHFIFGFADTLYRSVTYSYKFDKNVDKWIQKYGSNESFYSNWIEVSQMDDDSLRIAVNNDGYVYTDSCTEGYVVFKRTDKKIELPFVYPDNTFNSSTMYTPGGYPSTTYAPDTYPSTMYTPGGYSSSTYIPDNNSSTMFKP